VADSVIIFLNQFCCDDQDNNVTTKGQRVSGI